MIKFLAVKRLFQNYSRKWNFLLLRYCFFFFFAPVAELIVWFSLLLLYTQSNKFTACLLVEKKFTNIISKRFFMSRNVLFFNFFFLFTSYNFIRFSWLSSSSKAANLVNFDCFASVIPSVFIFQSHIVKG